MTRALEPIPNPDSPLRRCDPRWKLAAAVATVGATASVQTVPAAALALAGSGVLAWLARVPPRWYLRRLGSVAPFLLACVLLLPVLVPDPEPFWRVGTLPVSARGTRLALLVCIKAVALVTVVWALLVSAPLHVLLHAAQALYAPGLVVHVTLLTYRYVYLLSDELSRIRLALRVRGYRNRPTLRSYRTAANVVGTLFSRGHERAERVGQAMHCRGFAGQFRSLAEFRTRPTDLLIFGAAAACAGAVLVLDGWLRANVT